MNCGCDSKTSQVIQFQGAGFSGLADVRAKQIQQLLAQYTQLQIDGDIMLKYLQEGLLG